MRLVALCLFTIGSGFLPAQQKPGTPVVRSISVKAVSTSPQGLVPIEFGAIAAAWKARQVNLTIENRLDPASIDKAKEVIDEMYGSAGHAVRVEHNVRSMRPRAVEVAFQVVELCRCN